MTLQSSGQISLSDVNVELRKSASALISLNDADVRELFDVPSGTISMSNGYGKSWGAWSLRVPAFNGGYISKFSVVAEDSAPEGIFFKSDGTKMYVLGGTGKDVNEYNLSTAWSVSTASYVQAFSVSAQETSPRGVFFKSDGTKMYVIGRTGLDVNEYSLSTAWNISTASYVQAFSVSAQETNPRDITFSTDGTKMYVLGDTGNDVNEYNLSTAWNVSTASYVRAFSVSTQTTAPRGVFFKSDGTKMYVSADNIVYEYSLSTAWNISTASYVQNYSFSQSGCTSIFFKPDGTKIYALLDIANYESVNEYSLGTAWNISTASFVLPTSNYLNTYTAATPYFTSAIFFKPDGTKMYASSSGANVQEWNLSTAWNISTASYVQSFSVSAQETTPAGIFFKSDGTKMYVTGYSGLDVNEYSLSTAWNISTASYVQAFSVSAQTPYPYDVFFKTDGTKMYVISLTGGVLVTGGVLEYNLSTAWNISTASYVQAFGTTAGRIATTCFFKDDGTKMFVITYTANAPIPEIQEYSLSTAWNISTASYVRAFNVRNFAERPSTLFIRPEGSKAYISSRTSIPCVSGVPSLTSPSSVWSIDLDLI